jgi:hypothetical protein
MYADLILKNGKIVTIDEKETIAEAVAVKFDKILAVGTTKEVKGLIGADTKVVDLKGRTVVPGLIDTHCHMTNSGLSLIKGEIDCSYEEGIRSIADIQALIAEKVKTTPKGEWIIARQFDETKLIEKRNPNKWDLDKVAPDHPVSLTPVGGHFTVFNSNAFAITKASKDTPDPVAGRFERDPVTGELTGGAHERAAKMIRPVRGAPTHEEILQAVILMGKNYVAAGLTVAHDSGVPSTYLKAYQEALANGELPIRIRADIAVQHLPEMVNMGILPQYGNDWIQINGTKTNLDGAISARSAWVSEPYFHKPNYYGEPAITREELRDIVMKMHKANLRMIVHANGDVAIELFCDVLEEALNEYPRENHRNRIEHCTVMTPTLLKRVKKLGILPTIFGAYAYYHGDKILPAFGAERLDRMFCARDFLDAGIKVGAHSDHSCSPYPPLLGIHGLVNRKSVTGQDVGAKQKVSVMEALKLYTINGAYHSFEEDVLGSIEVGKLADMVVLNEDILSVPTETIKDIPIDMTIIGGKIAYER